MSRSKQNRKSRAVSRLFLLAYEKRTRQDSNIASETPMPPAHFDQRCLEARQQLGMHIGDGECCTASRLNQYSIGIGEFQAGSNSIRI